MSKVSLYHDLRAVKDGNPGPVKIKVFHKKKAIMLPTIVKITADQWMERKVINHPRARQFNSYLALRMADVTSAIMELDVRNELETMEPAALKKHLLRLLGHVIDKEEPDMTFYGAFTSYIEHIKTEGTRRVYKQTMSRLLAFCQQEYINIEKLKFEDITVNWLKSFDEFMAITAKKRNARNIHLRNVRTVFNYAIKTLDIDIPYPFRKFKIVAEETANRAMTVEQLRRLKDYPITEPHIEKARDMFMLMIYLIGINAADLFQAKHKQLVNGRLEYWRQKMNKTAFYSIKIEPEAMAIMEKYRGKRYLLDICDTYSDYQDYLRKMDKYLKKIGPSWIQGQGGKKHYDPIFPELSSYWSRHTWATLAVELGIPINTASESLGHKIGSKTTAIYIHYKRKRIDTANREIIDYIFNNIA